MKKQKQEEFYLLIDFLDKLIDNKPEDVTHNELWLAPNLFDILKLKEYRDFKIQTDENIPVNQVIIGQWLTPSNK
jgi:hypothetical protein